MASTTTREELLSIAKEVSFGIPEDEISEYEELLARTKKTLGIVAAMDGRHRHTYPILAIGIYVTRRSPNIFNRLSTNTRLQNDPQEKHPLPRTSIRIKPLKRLGLALHPFLHLN